jgi:hypothetical protein
MQIQRQEDQWPARVAEVRTTMSRPEVDHWGLWPYTNEPIPSPESTQRSPR